MSNRLDFGTDK